MARGGGDGGGSNALITIERVAVLQRVSLFSEVPGHMLVAVARLLEEVSVDAGALIIERGAIEDWLYVIAEGSARVHVGGRTLGRVAKGDVVGELSVLASEPRSASVTAIEPCLLLRLRRGPLDELLDDRPEIARGVIATLVRLLHASNADGDEIDP